MEEEEMMETKRDEGFELALEVKEIVTSVQTMKIMLENTILNTDEMHDVMQTFLTGVVQRIGGIHDDIMVGLDKTEELQKKVNALSADNKDYARMLTIRNLALELAKAQEKKRGKHKTIKELIAHATAEVESQEGCGTAEADTTD